MNRAKVRLKSHRGKKARAQRIGSHATQVACNNCDGEQKLCTGESIGWRIFKGAAILKKKTKVHTVF